MSTPPSSQATAAAASRSQTPVDCSTPMDASQPSQAALEADSTFASNPQQIPTPTPSDSGSADPFDSVKPTMTTPMPIDARSIIRLLQCQQCSFPLRSPVTLPCGNSLCSQYCLPERFKRENISFPMSAARSEGFICPFKDCGQEHSVADCALDVTLSKVIERIALEVADHRQLNDVAPTLLEESLRPRTETELLHFQAAGLSGPEPNSLTLSGGTLAATYTMAEQGKLRYDSDVVYTPPPDSPESDTTQTELNDSLFTLFSTSARTEVDCQLCWNLLYEPLTTPCGHTFCRSCVARMLDHTTSCPFCRKPLQLPPGVQDVVGNQRMQSIISLCWSTELTAREAMIAVERESLGVDIPIFVCTLAYPGMPTFLHIFEPRYKLMMRRVIESETKTFGMVMYNLRGTPQGEGFEPAECNFLRRGTLLKIIASEMTPDGRSWIECAGVSRFNVQSWRESDGYIVGRTERIEDISLEMEERLEAEDVQRTPGSTPSTANYPPQDAVTQNPTAAPVAEGGQTQLQQANADPLAELDTLPTAELLRISVEFVRRMRAASAPWLNERTLQGYGRPPVDDARTFPYWFASVLPISEEEKYDLLGMTSVRERVKRTARWVRRIEAQRCVMTYDEDDELPF